MVNRLETLNPEQKELVEQEYLSRFLSDQFRLSGVEREYDGLELARLYNRLDLTVGPETTKAELIQSLRAICSNPKITDKQIIKDLTRLYQIKFDPYAYHNTQLDTAGDHFIVFRVSAFRIGNKLLGENQGLRFLSLIPKE